MANDLVLRGHRGFAGFVRDFSLRQDRRGRVFSGSSSTAKSPQAAADHLQFQSASGTQLQYRTSRRDLDTTNCKFHGRWKEAREAPAAAAAALPPGSISLAGLVAAIGTSTIGGQCGFPSKPLWRRSFLKTFTLRPRGADIVSFWTTNLRKACVMRQLQTNPFGKKPKPPAAKRCSSSAPGEMHASPAST